MMTKLQSTYRILLKVSTLMQVADICLFIGYSVSVSFHTTAKKFG